jgi:hypothetical protein
MRPRHINVFDGLRITTEHMDHLQGAFLTGLQDLREASGLGRVVRGFEVSIADESHITVQPGLAFDLDKNRIVNDAPLLVDAALRGGEDALWVTIRYEQEESGETEGKQILIWDGCAVELTAIEPGPNDLAIPIARLTQATGGQLAVSSPGEPTPGSDAAEDAGTGEAGPPPATSAAPPTSLSLIATQGTTRLANLSSPLGTPLASLAAIVRGQRDQPTGGSPAPSLTLATGDITVDFTPARLSCQVILTAGVAGTEEGDGTAPDRALPAPLQSTSWGEISLAGEMLAQHALTQCVTGEPGHAGPNVGQFRSFLGEGVVAQLPLNAWAGAAEPGEAGAMVTTVTPELAVCRSLQLSVRAAWDAAEGVHVILSLDWKGGGDDDQIQLLETTTVRVHTEALLAWSALGTA